MKKKSLDTSVSILSVCALVFVQMDEYVGQTKVKVKKGSQN